MFASMIFKKEPFFHGHDNYDQVCTCQYLSFCDSSSTVQLPIKHISVPHTDPKPLIYTHIHSEWQQEWDSQPNNKLHKIYPNVYHLPPLSSQFSQRSSRL